MSGGVFITGISSGLGRGFCEEYLERGWQVYGLSRRGTGMHHERLHEACADLADLDAVPAVLERLVARADIELAILNAAILGEIKPMPETSLVELRRTMDVNVWSNKLILDWFAARRAPREIVLISSGAAVTGHKGWGMYALSKAMLNMLAQLYAHDMDGSHIIALAPGLVHSPMQDHIYENVDEDRFPSVRHLKRARGTPAMPAPREVARRIAEAVAGPLREHPSGSFVDIREL